MQPDKKTLFAFPFLWTQHIPSDDWRGVFQGLANEAAWAYSSLDELESHDDLGVILRLVVLSYVMRHKWEIPTPNPIDSIVRYGHKKTVDSLGELWLSILNLTEVLSDNPSELFKGLVIENYLAQPAIDSRNLKRWQFSDKGLSKKVGSIIRYENKLFRQYDETAFDYLKTGFPYSYGFIAASFFTQNKRDRTVYNPKVSALWQSFLSARVRWASIVDKTSPDSKKWLTLGRDAEGNLRAQLGGRGRATQPI